MRTIHDNLLAAQQSGAANPYIHLSIDGTDYTSRLISLEHIEEPYRDRATIVLANSDWCFDGFENNLCGKSFTIGYGYTDSGDINRYLGDGLDEGKNPAMPTLWIKTQSMVSKEGQLVCILEAEGGWGKLREFTFVTTSSAPHFNISNLGFTSTETVYVLIQKVLEECGFSLSVDTVDDIIQSFHPVFSANPLGNYESPGYLISERLLPMTKCFLRQVESLGFEVVYPQDSDSIDETYYSDQAPYFKDYVERVCVLIPNHIVVFCNTNPDMSDVPGYDLLVGHAKDPNQFNSEGNYIGSYEEVAEYILAPLISNQIDADNRADAILTRYKAEKTLAGRLVLPFHDCRVELYDKVEIVDSRES